MNRPTKPVALTPDFDSIPTELTQLRQWLVWRYDWKIDPKKTEGGKWDKPPFNARNGKHASTTDASTWSSFTEAVTTFQGGGWDGIGFVLTEDDPLAGLDLDDSFVTESGEPTDQAREYLKLLNSYTERSPSGKGFRAFAKGALPPGGRKKGDVEVYESGRYLTVTGNRLVGFPATVGTRQAELEELHRRIWPLPAPRPQASKGSTREGFTGDDQALLERVYRAKNGQKVQALYDGSLTGYESASNADFALCCCLAFWTGPDPARLDRLFRRSGLLRDKWDERHYSDGSTYGQKTVERAIAGCSTFYTKPQDANTWQAPLNPDLDEEAEDGTVICLADVQPQSVRWLWRGRIPFGKITLIDGDPGTGKTTMALDIAARLSRGAAMPEGSSGLPPGNTLIISVEDGAGDTIRPRAEAAEALLDHVLILTGFPDGNGHERLPMFPEDTHRLRDLIVKHSVQLVIIDPLMAVLSPEINSFRDQDVRRALAPLSRVAETTGAAIVVLRHLNKGTGASAIYRGGGSIGIIGAARSALLVAKDPDDPEKRILASVKSNLASAPPTLSFRLTSTGEGLSAFCEWLGEVAVTADSALAPPESTGSSQLDEAVEFLRESLAGGPMPYTELESEATAAGISKATLRRARKRLGIKSQKTGGQSGHWEWSLPK